MKSAALAAAAMLSAAHTINVVLAQNGTCTQGGTGAFLASLFYGVPLGLLACGAWWFALAPGAGGERWVAKGVVAIALVSMLGAVTTLWSPLVQSTIAGHHLCGADFDDLVRDGTDSAWFHRLWAPAQLTLLLFVAAVCLARLASEKSAKK